MTPESAATMARDAFQVAPATRALDALSAMPAPNATGLLFPGGALGDTDPHRSPIRAELLITMLRKAEEMAGIPHINGRAYHGFKRHYATQTGDNRRAAAMQSGTNESTLRDIYEQDTLAPKVELAKMLEGMRA